MKAQARQWIAALTCTFSVAMTGVCFVWTTPLMVRFTLPNSTIPMTSNEAAWVTSIVEIGSFFANCTSGILADRFGRKRLMWLSGPLVITGWVLIGTTRSLPVLYFVRFLHGISIAISYSVGPMYLAEVAEPKIRGLIGGQFLTMWYLGCLFAYSTGPYLSYTNYLYISAVFPFISMILFLFVPESPYFYLMVNEEEKASKSFQWLRGSEDISEEFLNIKKTVERENKQKGSWKDLFATKKDIKSFLIVQFVSMIKCLSGLVTIILCATQIFDAELGNVLGSDELTIILGVILCLATFLGAFMTDCIGRKPLLIISAGGSAFFNAIIAIIYYLDSQTTIDVSSYKWISFVSVILFSIISNIGLGPLLQTIQAEYFPSHIRGIGGGTTQSFAALWTFISIIQYKYVGDYFGTYMNFAIFSFVSLIGAISFVYLITETAGKSLGQIQESFEKNENKNKNEI